MTVTVPNEQEIVQEAVEVLLEHLGAAKVARFLAAWQTGAADYLAIRKQLFDEETVATLSEKVQTYEKGKEDSA